MPIPSFCREFTAVRHNQNVLERATKETDNLVDAGQSCTVQYILCTIPDLTEVILGQQIDNNGFRLRLRSLPGQRECVLEVSS